MLDKKRTQLNLRFDGKDSLLETLKGAAQSRGESLNGYCIRVLAESVGMSSGDASIESSATLARHDTSNILDKVETMLEERLGGIEERLGKLRA
ncbi:hypothetical protein PN499_05430 [Kamptonema animale CS-326]|uniref:hypothetical protein n=1 Tax=Kamptonema animale TaxID=92934 RepID=UPI00232BB235|nr:hypothetical protein [Kamptonema animale]MDB9510618.1 hypothetical protein [Kamptonema animale CS-326]